MQAHDRTAVPQWLSRPRPTACGFLGKGGEATAQETAVRVYRARLSGNGAGGMAIEDDLGEFDVENRSGIRAPQVRADAAARGGGRGGDGRLATTGVAGPTAPR
jgi:hypothetical protein